MSSTACICTYKFREANVKGVNALDSCKLLDILWSKVVYYNAWWSMFNDTDQHVLFLE